MERRNTAASQPFRLGSALGDLSLYGATERPKPELDSELPDEDACPHCHGARFVRPKAAPGEPGFGKAVLCRVCVVIPPTEGVPESLRGATFESFNVGLNPSLLEAWTICKKVAEGLAPNALLVGDVGTGKSHLGAAALNASVHPKPGYFYTVSRLLASIRSEIFDTNGPQRQEADVVRRYAETRGLLVLDDLGTEKATEWAQQTLYEILNYRYEWALPTILTGNEPDKIDERIESRFSAGYVVCSGQDVRRLDRQEGAA
jgi:DNA replication protein DnaC